jgi:putative ABC transport system substrate-binding protein
MRRREFITFVGGAVTWPVAARAQQSAMPVIGFLRNTSFVDSAQLLAAFRHGLSETGYAEGRNVTFEYRWAEGQSDRLPTLAADLVGQAAVIVAGGGDAAAAAKAATTSVPIVFAVGDDPIETGLVTTLNRPAANITGVSFFTTKLGPKRIEILREMVPNLRAVGYLGTARYEVEIKELQAAANALRLKLYTASGGSDHDFEPAFAAFRKMSVGGLLVQGGAFYFGRRRQLVELAARYTIPTIYSAREFTLAGGLMSYSPSLPDAYRQAGIYTGRILGGALPADLPIVLPTRFYLVINLKTAKALNVQIPPGVLAIADEVIE